MAGRRSAGTASGTAIVVLVALAGILWLCDTPDLIVYNTHLDHESADARLESVRLIARDATERADGRVVVMGDFNALPDWPPVQYMTGSGDPDTPLVLIDIVAALGAATSSDGEYPSDHFPVVAVLSI